MSTNSAMLFHIYDVLITSVAVKHVCKPKFEQCFSFRFRAERYPSAS